MQVLKKYSTANGMQGADFMWMKLLSIECMIQLRFAILEKNLPSQTKILYETLSWVNFFSWQIPHVFYCTKISTESFIKTPYPRFDTNSITLRAVVLVASVKGPMNFSSCKLVLRIHIGLTVIWALSSSYPHFASLELPQPSVKC